MIASQEKKLQRSLEFNIKSKRTPQQKEIRRQEILIKYELKIDQQFIEVIHSRKIPTNKFYEKINTIKQATPHQAAPQQVE